MEAETTERNEEAEKQYATAWSQYLLSQDDSVRTVLGERMDALQPAIAKNPNDPRWQAFKKTLPGFEEFWTGFPARAISKLCGE